MAIVKVHFFSEALLRHVNFMAVIPIDKRSVDGEKRRSKNEPLKTLYLLHGIYGSEYDWLVNTRVARWAQEKNLAVILPAGENKFYGDVEDTSDRLGTFVGEDLVDFTRIMFPLSARREDTYVGGFSMGGYGAIATALRYPETFSKAGAFSSSLSMDKPWDRGDSMGFKSRKGLWEATLGLEEDFPGSKNDCRALAGNLAERRSKGERISLPEFYISCGRKDGLLSGNRSYQQYLKELGYKVDYREADGGHEWDFWNREIQNFMEWLPLER